MHKLVDLESLKTVISAVKREGKKIVFTNGCFDILHIGHIRYLQQAKALGDLLVVGINSDESVRALKGEGRPVNDERERAEMIAALECVDYVVIFTETTPLDVISQLEPHFHVKGGDYRGKSLAEAGLVSSYGGKVVLVGETAGKSTTALIAKLVEKMRQVD
ncbi:MAG: D-glycero-beta-D-manno-heptose 1-phosphate adenylyltransferase [Clostridia bacterium]|nr:D-glycero-beta-D-manno-heptose 1-phosphate adenylyltransferase [Clostridia bacterium]